MGDADLVVTVTSACKIQWTRSSFVGCRGVNRGTSVDVEAIFKFILAVLKLSVLLPISLVSLKFHLTVNVALLWQSQVDFVHTEN